MRKAKTGWSKTAVDAFKLGTSAPLVIALRMAKIAKGGAAGKRESKRMVAEKMKAASDAGLDAAHSILTGNARQVPARTLSLYQRRVGENLRRLLKLR